MKPIPFNGFVIWIWSEMTLILSLYVSLLDPMAEITIDETRHILYTRSEKGTIQVYDMGTDGCSMSRVTAVSHYSMMKQAIYYAR